MLRKLSPTSGAQYLKRHLTTVRPDIATGRRMSTRKSLLDFKVDGDSRTIERPRLGHLKLGGRIDIETPHYIAPTSRGTIPHVTQDLVRDSTAIKAEYVAVEDCK